MLLQTGSPPGLALVRRAREAGGLWEAASVGVTSLGGAEGKAEGVPVRRKEGLFAPLGLKGNKKRTERNS